MHKIYSVFFFTLVFVNEINCQAAVDIPLLITENNNPLVYELAIGLDLTATNCIDPLLGEFNIPFPPISGFFIVFDLTPYGCPPLISFNDYRSPGNPPAFPFTGTITHTLIWQRSQAGTAIIIEFNIPYEVQMMIRDPFNGTLLNLGPYTGAGIAIIPGSYQFQSVFLIMDYTAIVPVELNSFNALVLEKDRAVRLDWSTSTEINNYGFEILRFTQNDGEWEGIGFVPGFGTTTEPKSYSFIDEKVSTGTYEYRLKQIDFDGSFEYSIEIEVEVDFSPKEFVLYQNYPNPFNPSTAIKYSLPVESVVKINIYNSLGQKIEELVSEIQTEGNYDVTWNAQDYSSGVYYYSFEVNSSDGSQSHHEMKKIVFLK